VANPSYTHTLTNGTTADASQVMQNFNDILNGVIDGTKDLSISALTVAGAASFTGNVTIGNASTDDLTVTASLASTIPIKTTNSYDIGSSTLGLRALYFGANSQTVNIKASSSLAATWTLTLPTTDGTTGQLLRTDGSGVTSWVSPVTTVAQSGSLTLSDTDGYTAVLITTGASDRTVTLPTVADNAGREITIKKVDSGAGTLTIDGEGSETIDDATTVVLFKQFESVTVYSDGSEWHISAARWASGDYTPTSAASTNVDAVANGSAKFTRLNKDYVQVAGYIEIDPTATGATTVDLTIPIASNFAANTDGFGTSVGGSSTRQAGMVFADATDDGLTISFIADDTANRAHRFTFLYKII
jgi:hypothetical protein